MKKIFLSLILAAATQLSFGQLVISSDTTWEFSMVKGGAPKTISTSITNTGSDSVVVTWNRSNEVAPSGWSCSGICDWVTCYQNNTASHSATIMAGQTHQFHVDVTAAAGATDGPYYLTLTTSAGPITFAAKVSPASVRDLDFNSQVSLYPNPASNFINMNLLDKNIEAVSIVSVIGKRVGKFNVEGSSVRVPLDNINVGVYMAQFLDKNGKVIGVKRFTKQ